MQFNVHDITIVLKKWLIQDKLCALYLRKLTAINAHRVVSFQGLLGAATALRNDAYGVRVGF